MSFTSQTKATKSSGSLNGRSNVQPVVGIDQVLTLCRWDIREDVQEHLILRRFTLKVRFDLRRSCAPAALGVAGGRATQRSAPPPTGPVTPRRVPMDARLW
uniref:C2 NT-type domain-containing protein n=1 Tax=Mesocestoides corti TaxID=53468 RepID=A0A5K3FE29_MESCO